MREYGQWPLGVKVSRESIGKRISGVGVDDPDAAQIKLAPGGHGLQHACSNHADIGVLFQHGLHHQVMWHTGELQAGNVSAAKINFDAVQLARLRQKPAQRIQPNSGHLLSANIFQSLEFGVRSGEDHATKRFVRPTLNSSGQSGQRPEAKGLLQRHKVLGIGEHHIELFFSNARIDLVIRQGLQLDPTGCQLG